jgi:uncharacterized protein (TIGR03790 family)
MGVTGATMGCSSVALAGGGPENVLVVVNSSSLDSKTIANHYVALRSIPPTNVVYIDWRGGREDCQGPQFLEKILQPTVESIAKRKLAGQIDYVVYSCDFPWRVNLQPLFPEEKFSKVFRPIASTTGATYLWQFMRDKNPAIVMPNVNFYVPPSGATNDQACTGIGNVQSRGFRSSFFWEPNGGRSTKRGQGVGYLLSTMLGVTTGRGNSVDEILRYLERAADADATRPRGAFYFMKNDNIRSTTRDACFPAAVQLLTRMGITASVVPGVVPTGAVNVLGIITGSATVALAGSGSQLAPGAIVDNLTSLGGDLRSKAGQTPISEYMRLGAAGASGTVVEPLAIQAKFPLPTLFIHYARGCSLAEAFYQSVAGPYQLLILGDPLCQPWATPPTVSLDSIQPNETIRGKITLQPKVTTLPMHRAGSMELFVDGLLRARFPADKPLQMDTAKLIDGYHEMRFVAVDSGPIETRGRLILPVIVDNQGGTVELTAAPTTGVTPETKIRIAAKQAGATSIVVRHNDREIGRVEGESGEFEVLAATFGRGPIVVQAVSAGPKPAQSAPLQFVVQ